MWKIHSTCMDALGNCSATSWVGIMTDKVGTYVSRRVFVLLMICISGVISGLAGLLAHAAGNNIPSAILTGGGAFAATFGLLLTAAHYTSAN